MAKKIVDPATTAVEALTRSLADAGPKMLFGSAKVPGFFSGSSKPIKAAAAAAVEKGWLEPTGQWSGTGAKKKELYRLSAAGIHAVLHESETQQLLRGLKEAMQGQVQQLQTIVDQVRPLLAKTEPLVATINALERRVQPPSLEEILRQMGPPAPSAPVVQPPTSSVWLERVVPLAKQQHDKDRFQPLSLPALFQHVRSEQPTLTIGQFHDGLRTLRDQGRVRLIPFTRALATIDDARNALFLTGR